MRELSRKGAVVPPLATVLLAVAAGAIFERVRRHYHGSAERTGIVYLLLATIGQHYLRRRGFAPRMRG